MICNNNNNNNNNNAEICLALMPFIPAIAGNQNAPLF